MQLFYPSSVLITHFLEIRISICFHSASSLKGGLELQCTSMMGNTLYGGQQK